MKAVVAAFNQEKALVGAFSVITNLRMELFEAVAESPPDDVLGLLLQHRGLLWPEAGADEGEAPGGQTQVAVAAAGVAAERLAVPVAESLP